MSRTRLTALTMLLVATAGTMAVAQTPSKTPAKTPAKTTTVATPVATPTPAPVAAPVETPKVDSVAPKKSRFGGFMNKAKEVAGSKAGQKAAELAQSSAVKGAAVGVACTVVPGAAVASAVTGTGPCANSGLMSSLVNGKLKQAGSMAASGMAANATSGIAGKAMSKGGITGAAVNGALGAVGGSGAMSNLAAQAAALRIMQGGAGVGGGKAPDAAMAMKMLQSQGLSSAEAAAAIQGISMNPGASGLSPASAASALKMLKGMKIPGMGGGSPAEVPAALPLAVPVADMSKAYYDEVNDKGHMVAALVFSPGTDRLKLESTPMLQQIASMLEKHGKLKIRIEGHTDNVGSADANLALSEKRAIAVKTSLVEDYHIKADRLDAKGFGGTKPAYSNDTPEGRSSNWRIELVKM
jgi:outer membrane protein OmpA-like peptidoglycan-associated protein